MRKDEFPIVDKLVKDSINEVLDKIRGEIFDKYPEHQCTGELTGYADAIDDVLEIIDKYRKEQE